MTKKRHILSALAWVTLVALCYGMLGPLSDHHFPERLPYHGHLFLSPAPAFHVHPAYQSHSHREGSREAQGSIQFTTEEEGAQSSDGFSGWQLLSLSAFLSVAPLLLTTLAGLLTSRRALAPVFSPLSPPPRAAALPLH